MKPNESKIALCKLNHIITSKKNKIILHVTCGSQSIPCSKWIFVEKILFWKLNERWDLEHKFCFFHVFMNTKFNPEWWAKKQVCFCFWGIKSFDDFIIKKSICIKFEVNTITLSKVIKVLSCVVSSEFPFPVHPKSENRFSN